MISFFPNFYLWELLDKVHKPPLISLFRHEVKKMFLESPERGLFFE